MTGCQLAVIMFCDLQSSWMPREESMAQVCFCLCSCLVMHRALAAVTRPTRLRAKHMSMLLGNPLCALNDHSKK